MGMVGLMKHKQKQKVDRAIKVMKTLNKMQRLTKELRENITKKDNVIEVYNISQLEKSIFECSLIAVDVIGDNIYLDYLKKNRIKTIAEPNQYGWYHVQEKNKEPITKPIGTFPIKLSPDFGSVISPRRRRFKK